MLPGLGQNLLQIPAGSLCCSRLTCQVDKCGELQAVVCSSEDFLPRANQNMRSHIYAIAPLVDDINLQVESGVALWRICQTAKPTPASYCVV